MVPGSCILVDVLISANFGLAGEDGGAGHRLVSRSNQDRPLYFPD
jgi:hypothetical protein